MVLVRRYIRYLSMIYYHGIHRYRECIQRIASRTLCTIFTTVLGPVQCNIIYCAGVQVVQHTVARKSAYCIILLSLFVWTFRLLFRSRFGDEIYYISELAAIILL